MRDLNFNLITDKRLEDKVRIVSSVMFAEQQLEAICFRR